MDKKSLLSGAWVPVTKRLPSGTDRRIVVWNILTDAPNTVTVEAFRVQMEQIRDGLIEPSKIRDLVGIFQGLSYAASHWIDLPKPRFEDPELKKWIAMLKEKYGIDAPPF